MATAERLDIEESKHLVALEKLEGRNIPYQRQGALLAIRSNSDSGVRIPRVWIGVHGEIGWERSGGDSPLMILQKIQAAEDMIVVSPGGLNWSSREQVD